MKRKREVLEIKGSEIRSAIEELTVLVKLKSNDHNPGPSDVKIPTMPFLSICNLVLQVLGWFSYNTHTHPFHITLYYACVCVYRDICYEVESNYISFADKIGPTMTVLRKDIHQNIQVRQEKILCFLCLFANRCYYY